jgi:branched-chain amino acid transport system substrate-binding protein
LAGTDKPAMVRDAMAKIKDFKCVSGNISFDENGNPLKSAVILEYSGGTQKYVTTVNP